MLRHGNAINAFLEDQYAKGMDLAANSDRVELTAIGTTPAPTAYVAKFTCKGLVRRAGQVVDSDDFVVGIRFPEDYLRASTPPRCCRCCTQWNSSIQTWPRHTSASGRMPARHAAGRPALSGLRDHYLSECHDERERCAEPRGVQLGAAAHRAFSPRSPALEAAPGPAGGLRWSR